MLTETCFLMFPVKTFCPPITHGISSTSVRNSSSAYEDGEKSGKPLTNTLSHVGSYKFVSDLDIHCCYLDNIIPLFGARSKVQYRLVSDVGYSHHRGRVEPAV